MTVVERSLLLSNPHGLHARPISRVVELVGGFTSRLELRHGSVQADASSVLQLMSLGAGPGATLEARTEGQDAEALMAAFEALVRDHFGE